MRTRSNQIPQYHSVVEQSDRIPGMIQLDAILDSDLFSEEHNGA
jgi:hypothetical protein